MAGIYRSVEVVARPKDATLLDYHVQADAAGHLLCRVECSRGGSGISQFVTARLYADTSKSADGEDVVLGECLWTETRPVESHDYDPPDPANKGDELHDHQHHEDSWCGCVFSNDFHNIKLWTAETPNLYTLTLSLSGDPRNSRAASAVVQAESCRVGFRTVSIEGGQVRVNGRPITVCGMNRHEHDPDHGKTVSLESMMKDICLLKYVGRSLVCLVSFAISISSKAPMTCDATSLH
jgi:beta-galactosidase